MAKNELEISGLVSPKNRHRYSGGSGYRYTKYGVGGTESYNGRDAWDNGHYNQYGYWVDGPEQEENPNIINPNVSI